MQGNEANRIYSNEKARKLLGLQGIKQTFSLPKAIADQVTPHDPRVVNS